MMRLITGAILILAGEQAFAHAHQIGFPHQVYAHSILFPASIVLTLIGVGIFAWGLVSDRRSP